MSEFTTREQIVEVINRLFYYTDNQQWDKIISEVFADKVELDMTSLGATKVEMLTSQQICENWKEGFKDLDAVHHQSGNIIVDFEQDIIHAKANAIASHYKENATYGKTRIFVGSYDFSLSNTNLGYRIDKMKFNLKYMDGNIEMQ